MDLGILRGTSLLPSTPALPGRLDAPARFAFFNPVQTFLGGVYRFVVEGVEDVECRFCFIGFVSLFFPSPSVQKKLDM